MLNKSLCFAKLSAAFVGLLMPLTIYAKAPGSMRCDHQSFVNPPYKTSEKDIRFEYKQDFLPAETRFAELADSQGNIILFRTISQAYIPGFVGYWAKQEGMISTSPSPHIAEEWWISEESRVLILKQNLFTDSLSYWNLHKSRSPNATQNRCQDFIDSNTTLKDVGRFYETQVPIDKQNVLVSILRTEFIAIAKNFDQPFTANELLQKVLVSGKAEFIK